MTALACSKAPDGRARRSLRLLADKAVELEYTDKISYETVRRILKKEIKPWLKKNGGIPPKANAEFVADMEKVLDLYRQPYDAHYPVVCLDEMPRWLIGEFRAGQPMIPGITIVPRSTQAETMNRAVKLIRDTLYAEPPLLGVLALARSTCKTS